MLPPEYLTKPFWDTPPRSVYGDDDSGMLYRAVGEALTRWEEMECALGWLFSVLVESTSPAASRVYGSLSGARGRREALEDAAEIFFAVEDRRLPAKPRFNQLIRTLSHAFSRRNDIAHGMVVHYAATSTEGGGYFLVSPDYNSRRNKAFPDFLSLPAAKLSSVSVLNPFDWSTHKYAYDANIVSDYGNRFAFMFHEALDLTHELQMILFDDRRDPLHREAPRGHAV